MFADSCFYSATLASAVYTMALCLSVRLSVTSGRSIKTAKYIIKQKRRMAAQKL